MKASGALPILALLALTTVAQQAVAQQTAAPPPQVGISPSRFELEIDGRPTTESFRVINLGKDPLEVEVSVANWEMSEKNQVVVVEPTEQSLDQWMVVNPLRFTIPPGKTQTVRFSIRPRVRPQPGEHRGMIYLDQILPPVPAGSGIRLRFQYGVAIYGYAGEITRLGTLHEVSASVDQGAPRFGFDLSSEGNAHVRMSGRYAIWTAAAFPGKGRTQLASSADEGPADAPLPEGMLATGDLPSLPVLPATRRVLTLDPELRLPPGGYVLDLEGSLQDQRIDRTVPFEVPSGRPAGSQQ